MSVSPAQYDISASKLSPELLGQACCTNLATKGFCVVDAGFQKDHLSKVLEDVAEMDAMGKFSMPPALIAEGLFGQEGSCRIAEMDRPSDLSTDGEHICRLDEWMTQLSTSINDNIGQTLGMDCRTRTFGLVHETDSGLSDVPPLTEKDASMWLNTFVRAKVIIIVCLGQASGTMELRPFDDEVAEPVEITTNPGTVIILRSDVLWHKHFAHGKVHLLTCHLLEPKHLDKRSSYQATLKMTPVAKAIDNWCLARLHILKSLQDGGDELKGLPKDFAKAMNQVCFKGQRIAIRSCGLKVPTAYDSKSWFCALSSGPDFALQITGDKWNHSEYYDPDPECWRNGKTFTQHCSFVDGLDLFDNRLFTLSPAEASSMDPHQTNVLECGYEALFNCNYRKKSIMNTVGGVYVGTAETDWVKVPRQKETSVSATGGSASITSNRLSFCLGLKGPSMSMDSENASGLMAVHLAAEGVMEKGRGVSNAFSVAGGVHFNLSPYWWPQLQASGLLSSDGRSKTYDESADGYGRGDGIVLYCIKRLTDSVDGQQVMVENEPLLGVLAGSYMNNNGMCASMGAPSAAGEQEMIFTALRDSGINALDIERIEAHGEGIYLADAIESGAFMRALRFQEDTLQIPLMVTALKTHNGNSAYSAGAMSLLSVLQSQASALVNPNCHLGVLSPHRDCGDSALIGTEHLEHSLNVSYCSITAKGFGGTNVHAITWASSREKRPDVPRTAFNRKRLIYWPGGGGELDDDIVPRKKDGYFIAGTWNRWTPEQMEPEGTGSFSFTVVLGENRWEKFQIWLDGSEKRKLHPASRDARKGQEVLGPVEDAEGLKWCIDGRAYTDSEGAAEVGSGEGAVEVGSAHIDHGRAGDKYRIHLRIAGKYRTVDWEKLPRQDDMPLEKVPQGTYAICASWNQWEPVEMFRDDSDPDIHYVEVEMSGEGGYFTIVRDEDPEQVVYPDRFAADGSATVLGPDSLVEDLCWFIDGRPGDVFRIMFQRCMEFGLDNKKVSWDRVSP